MTPILGNMAVDMFVKGGPIMWPILFCFIAALVVVIELWAIAYIQNRYMQTPFWRAALQVVLGGALVFAAGILIGSA